MTWIDRNKRSRRSSAAIFAEELVARNQSARTTRKFLRTGLSSSIILLVTLITALGARSLPAAIDPAPNRDAAKKDRIAKREQKPIGEAHIFKKVNDRELQLYVVKPKDWTPPDQRPALVLFHGGGWVGGSPASLNRPAEYFASRGIVCVLVQYRLLKDKPNEPPTDCIQDAKSAMRWVRSHAPELGIDSKRIGASGGSAGGHLAAFLGLAEGFDDPNDDIKLSAKPAALVLFNPVFNNGPGQYGYGRVKERFKEFSPAHNITSNAPPTIVFLGTKDHLIPVETVKNFKADMEKVGVRCDTVFHEGQGHGFFNHEPNQTLTLIEADKFLASLGWLKGPPTLTPPAN